MHCEQRIAECGHLQWPEASCQRGEPGHETGSTQEWIRSECQVCVCVCKRGDSGFSIGTVWGEEKRCCIVFVQKAVHVCLCVCAALALTCRMRRGETPAD